jgi:toxin ParE1/3/4
VAAFRFSQRAESDLLSIGNFTLRTWGKAQTIRYLTELEVCCQTLVDNPALGRSRDHIRPGLRRVEHGSHVGFYRQQRAGVLISRILHQRMLPTKLPIDNRDAEPIPSLLSVPTVRSFILSLKKTAKSDRVTPFFSTVRFRSFSLLQK